MKGDERIRTAVCAPSDDSVYEGENARRILHAPRSSGTVGPWRIGDVIESEAQAALLQAILEGRVVVRGAAS